MTDIVFLADGTWNGPGQVDSPEAEVTNVFKLFGLLAGDAPDASVPVLSPEQERVLAADGGLAGARPQQVAKYLHGVGDSSNKLVQMLGGVFGAGVIARIVRGYTFVSRHWQPGDRIFIVGFSRGAYTARALAGMITSMGLLPQADCADHERAYRLGGAVWTRYRLSRTEPAAERSALEKVLGALPSFLQPGSAAADQPSAPLRPADVDVVAVWDTVGALGIPVYREGGDARIDLFRFCDCRLSGRVLRGYHALAWEEQRIDFTPALWAPRDGIVQMLFAGAHADVGGGYPQARGESDLAHLGLQWMQEQLIAEGLRFRALAGDEFPGSAFGPAHQPWTVRPWSNQPHVPRGGDAFCGLPMHPSLHARIARGGPYTVLPSGRTEPPRTA